MNILGKAKTDIEINSYLKPYHELLAQVDRLLEDVRCRYPADIACHKGCDCGCRNLSIFPVEALSVFMAIQGLPAKTAAAMRQRAEARSIWECPLLKDRACELYPFRPMICRTHGFPLQTIYKRRPYIGRCCQNFKNWSAIPRDAITDLDRINSSLRDINARVMMQMALKMPARLSIAAALHLHRAPT